MCIRDSVYSDQTAVLGPLATYAEPHAYDLCDAHSERISAPRGWEILRLAPDPAAAGPTTDDLLALADAVREAARPLPPVEPAGPTGVPSRTHGAPGAAVGLERETVRRGHLRSVPTLDD